MPYSNIPEGGAFVTYKSSDYQGPPPKEPKRKKSTKEFKPTHDNKYDSNTMSIDDCIALFSSKPKS